MSGYLTRLGGDIRRDAPEPTRGFADALTAGPAASASAKPRAGSGGSRRMSPDSRVR